MRYILLAISVLVGCDTLQVYREPGYPLTTDGHGQKTSFLKVDKANGLEIGGRVVLFNFSMGMWLDIKNKSKDKLILEPRRVKLRSFKRQKDLEITEVGLMIKDSATLNLDEQIEIPAGSSKYLYFSYDPTPFMPSNRLKEKPELMELDVLIEGLKKGSSNIKFEKIRVSVDH